MKERMDVRRSWEGVVPIYRSVGRGGAYGGSLIKVCVKGFRGIICMPETKMDRERSNINVWREVIYINIYLVCGKCWKLGNIVLEK